MSFLGNLFGSPSSAPAPQPTSAAPKISDAESQSAGLAEAERLKARGGTDKTILTTGLGDTSSGITNVNRTSALGGNSSLTQ